MTFLKGGQKRTTASENTVTALSAVCKRTIVVSLCATRWVEIHDAVVRFVEFFPGNFFLQSRDVFDS